MSATISLGLYRKRGRSSSSHRLASQNKAEISTAQRGRGFAWLAHRSMGYRWADSGLCWRRLTGGLLGLAGSSRPPYFSYARNNASIRLLPRYSAGSQACVGGARQPVDIASSRSRSTLGRDRQSVRIFLSSQRGKNMAHRPCGVATSHCGTWAECGAANATDWPGRGHRGSGRGRNWERTQRQPLLELMRAERTTMPLCGSCKPLNSVSISSRGAGLTYSVLRN
jgi:hypothetical protein